METSKAARPHTEAQPVTRFQIMALLALACLNMQDGFDILAISYAANAIATDWQLDQGALGVVLSAGLFGMMLGAMLLSPIADRIGRRPITILGLTLSGIGMLTATFAASVPMLMVGRVLTGLGVGAILASLNTLVAEFAGERYRGAAISILQLGFPLGAFLSSFIVAWLLDIGTWRHVFAFGAATSFLFIPVMLALPESMDYLARSGRPDALTSINATRRRLGMDALERLPASPPDAATQGGGAQAVISLFTPEYRLRTLLIWCAFFLVLTTLYFLLSWTPKLLIDAGFTEAQGNRGGRLINLTGMGGIVLLAVLSAWVRPSIITGFYLVCLAGLLFVLSQTATSLGTLYLVIAMIGFVIHGSMIGLYATTPALYPAPIRATGMGWAIGLSRFGAVLGPASAGFLLDAGWTPAQLFRIFMLPAITGAGIAFLLWLDERRRARKP